MSVSLVYKILPLLQTSTMFGFLSQSQRKFLVQFFRNATFLEGTQFMIEVLVELLYQFGAFEIPLGLPGVLTLWKPFPLHKIKLLALKKKSGQL